jgi:hypothetical protein
MKASAKLALPSSRSNRSSSFETNYYLLADASRDHLGAELAVAYHEQLIELLMVRDGTLELLKLPRAVTTTRQ